MAVSSGSGMNNLRWAGLAEVDLYCAVIVSRRHQRSSVVLQSILQSNRTYLIFGPCSNQDCGHESVDSCVMTFRLKDRVKEALDVPKNSLKFEEEKKQCTSTPLTRLL